LSSLCRIHQTLPKKDRASNETISGARPAGLFTRTLTLGTSWTACATMLFIVSARDMNDSFDHNDFIVCFCRRGSHPEARLGDSRA
ncbi:MAG: hypothetical protein ACKVX9_06400, partial [Blastocatellia bacterium]